MEKEYYSRLKRLGGIEVMELSTDEDGITSLYAVSVETLNPPVTLYQDIDTETETWEDAKVSRVLVNRTHFMKRVNPKHVLAEHSDFKVAPIEHVQILRRVRDGEMTC